MRAALLVAACFAAASALPPAAAPGGADAPKRAFVGIRKGMCAKCHNTTVKSWKETPHARAMVSLRPVAEKDDAALFARRKAAALDPAKDYSADPKCLACHATAYGKEGGYPEKVDDGNRERSEAMSGITCEACHGAASAYAEFKNAEKKKDGKRVFTKEELEGTGLSSPGAEACGACHNDSSPTKPATPFEYGKAKSKVHSHPEKDAGGKDGAKPGDGAKDGGK
jgi:hypothetical protein